jgi:2-keto-4-pentenoate hydratase
MGPHPRVVAALHAQLESWRLALREGATRVGWKLAYDIPEIDEVTGGEPVIGYLTSATVIEPGGTFRAASANLRAETELAIEIGPDSGVGALGVALELVDVSRPPHEMEAIVAANVFHRGAAFGPMRRRSVAGMDPESAIDSVAVLLDAVGERLVPGDRVLAGGLTHDPVEPGGTARASIEGLGSVAVEIAA